MEHQKSKTKRANMEEALLATGFGRFNYFLVIISGLILFNAALELLAISYVLPILAKCDLMLTVQQSGFLGGVGVLGITVSSHLWGFLADTIGRRKIIMPTLILAFFFTIISSFSTNYYCLLMARFCNGCMISASSATIYAFLGEFHSEAFRSKAINWAVFVRTSLGILIPLVALMVINGEWELWLPFEFHFRPYRLFMILCGLPGFIGGLCFLKLPESPKFLHSMGHEQQTLEILRFIYHINTGNPKDKYKIKALNMDLDSATVKQRARIASSTSKTPMWILKSMWRQTTPLFEGDLVGKTILICLIQFCIYFTSHGVYLWVPSLLNMVIADGAVDSGKDLCSIVENNKNTYKMTNETELTCSLESETFYHSSIFEGIITITFVIISWLSEKAGRRSCLCGILCISGVCGIACILVKIPMIAIYLFVVLLVCGCGATLVSSITLDLYATNVRGMAICISLMLGRVGSVIGTNVFAALISNNCQMALIIPSSALLFSALLSVFIPKLKIVKTEEEENCC